jgi:serine/threonine-protein kinase HipA
LPAFDINPNPYKSDHALAIDELDPSPSVANLRATHHFYRLAERDALTIEAEVREAVRSWPELAKSCQIARAERQQLDAIIDPSRD